PGCGPASERELGHDQGDSEAAFAAAFQQTDAAEVAADCHRRDRRRQGTPLPQRGAGLGERGGSLRGRRQRGRRLGTVLETTAAVTGEDQGRGDRYERGLYPGCA